MVASEDPNGDDAGSFSGRLDAGGPTLPPRDCHVIVEQDTIGHLIAILGSCNETVRRSARQALIAIGEPAVMPLTAALASPNERVRLEAVKTLTGMSDPRAICALVIALEDPHSGIRWLAAEGLVKLRRKALIPLLTALEQRPESHHLREGTRYALRTLAVGNLKPMLSPVVVALECSGETVDLSETVSAVLDLLKTPRRA